ncbi:MAPEG family protein [bacterium]|nr:MAPEG family protein [bacterium]
MSFELKIMIAIGFLYWFLGHVAVPTKMGIAGIGWNLGNRDTEPEFPAWVKRTERAQRNLLESLPLYFALAIGCYASGVSNGLTQMGAWLFLAGRLAHALTFMAGLPVVRTLAYGTAVAGLGLLASQLL